MAKSKGTVINAYPVAGAGKLEGKFPKRLRVTIGDRVCIYKPASVADRRSDKLFSRPATPDSP